MHEGRVKVRPLDLAVGLEDDEHLVVDGDEARWAGDPAELAEQRARLAGAVAKLDVVVGAIAVVLDLNG